MIVDDEPLARKAMSLVLAEFPDIEVIGECADGFEAVKMINQEKPEVVFLDIQMPKLDGFDVLELLDDPPFIVFVTAYNEYALKAFESHALDYILKPFKIERLAKTLERVEKRLDSRQFVRIHRSYLININYLSKIEPYTKDSKIAVLKDGKTLPVSRSGYQRLLTHL